tara:strand:+ start:1855 stop:2604 length:750 start_codon:yes stop_codon:yes gene_type:complete
MSYGKLSAEFYDADKPLADEEELSLYQQEFKANDLLLEPMCGSGRLLIPLLQAGLRVHGFDSSKMMLENCKKRAEQLNLSPNLRHCKIENFPEKQLYDGIIIPIGSFQLLYPRETVVRALTKFRHLLNPGGRLIMDLFIPWEVMCEDNDNIEDIRQVQLSPSQSIRLETKTTVNKLDQHMLSKLFYTKLSDNKCIEQEEERLHICWYYPHEMNLILEKHRFHNIKYEQRNISSGEYVTFICSKPDSLKI